MIKQIQNVKQHGITPVVAINASRPITPKNMTQSGGLQSRLARWVRPVTYHHRDGGTGAGVTGPNGYRRDEPANNFQFLYDEKQPIQSKIETIARKIYGAPMSHTPHRRLPRFVNEASGFATADVHGKNTSESEHDPELKGAPSGFTLPVRELRLSAVQVCDSMCGDIRTMPGFSDHLLLKSRYREDGNIVGLF